MPSTRVSSVNVTTPLVGVHRSTSEAWASNAQNNLAFDNLWVADAQVYQGATLLGSGTVSAAPASAGSPGVATTDSSAIDIDATGERILVTGFTDVDDQSNQRMGVARLIGLDSRLFADGYE